MQVSIKRLPKSRVRLSIQVPAERMEQFFGDAYYQVSAQVEIEGFRKGKAPKSLIRERVGMERITSIALEAALPRTYHEAVMAENLIPVAEPTVQVEKISESEPFIYQAEVDVLPVVDPGRYERVRVNAKKFAAKSVDQKEVDQSLARLQRSAAEPKTILRAASLGDLVEISYTGKVGGVTQDGLVSKHHPVILGEKMILPDFEQQLLGLVVGEKKIFTIDVPRGEGQTPQAVEFTITVDRVAELVIPPLDNDLAKKVGKATMAEVISEIENRLRQDLEDQAQANLDRAVVDAVLKGARLEMPEALIEREITHRLETLEQQLRQGDQTLETFLRRQKKTAEEFRKEIRPSAEAAVKTSLVLREISQREEITADGKENGAEEIFKKTVDWLVARAIR
ncbi:MAG: trigger factor [Patescibacteria group bacterium]